MKHLRHILFTCMAFALLATPAPGQQGQGKGQTKAQQSARAEQGAGGQRPEPAQQGGAARGQSRANANRSDAPPRGRAVERARPSERGSSTAARAPTGPRNGGRARGSASAARAEARAATSKLPQQFRALERSARASDRFALGAAAYAVARGLDGDALSLRRSADRLEVRNRDGKLLFDLDEARARDLGSWDLRLLGDREPTGNAPAFCRSGAGHPVWGREWCLDKGFGLGRSNDRTWSRTSTVEDIVFGRIPESDRVERPTLIDILGDVVLNRLAVHALSLGFGEPLSGRWVAEPASPQLLLVYSGDEPVAELVDLDRDDRVDVLYVTHYGW